MTDGPLRITLEDGVCTAVIDHPPINLFDAELMVAMDRFGRDCEADPDVRVVVVRSADPDFFIAHADVSMILALPRDQGDVAVLELGFFHAMVDRFRTMPKITIAVLEGAARGGGAELFSSFDLRYAALETGVLGQPEVPLGIIPGGSGTQRLPGLVGRARALEIITSGDDVDAATAERWGWVNRALPLDELDTFIHHLSRRIAHNPPAAVAAAKAAVAEAVGDPVPGLLFENQLFNQTLADPAAIHRMERFLELGGQTREVEREVTGLYDEL